MMKHNEMKVTVVPKLKLHPAAPDRTSSSNEASLPVSNNTHGKGTLAHGGVREERLVNRRGLISDCGVIEMTLVVACAGHYLFSVH